MKPTYVTFEQAKLLKEEGFDEACKNYYCKPYPNDIIELHTLREPTYQNKELLGIATAPEQWQVVEWLRVEKGILVFIEPANGDEDKCLFAWYICDYEQNILNSDSDYTAEVSKHFTSPQEAYSAAFDYVLTHLI